MADLAGLIERVGNLTGPSPEVDDVIYKALRPVEDAESFRALYEIDPDAYWYWMSPFKYTASLDAAVALVERCLPGAYRETTGPRRYLNIPTPVPARFRAEILHDEVSATAWHDREPIALVLALLRALQSQEAGND